MGNPRLSPRLSRAKGDQDYWSKKIARNRVRDHRHLDELKRMGWQILARDCFRRVKDQASARRSVVSRAIYSYRFRGLTGYPSTYSPSSP